MPSPPPRPRSAPLRAALTPPPPPPPLSISTGTLEFTIKGRNADAFFPVNVSFASRDTMCPLSVVTVLPVDEPADGRPLRYASTKGLTTDGYAVEA